MTHRHHRSNTLSRLSIGAAALVLAALPVAGAVLAQSSPSEGLYTEEQAARGERAFLGTCVGCHGYSMSSIFSRYTNAYIYYGKISTTMPWEDAGLLATQDYIDIVAYMLRENGFPAGDVELVPDRALLESIIPPRAGMQ